MMDDRVPSRAKLFRVLVLLRPTTENTLSASAFECGRTRTSFETAESLWNWSTPVTCAKWTKNTMEIYPHEMFLSSFLKKICLIHRQNTDKCIYHEFFICTDINNAQEVVSVVFLVYKENLYLIFPGSHFSPEVFHFKLFLPKTQQIRLKEMPSYAVDYYTGTRTTLPGSPY